MCHSDLEIRAAGKSIQPCLNEPYSIHRRLLYWASAGTGETPIMQAMTRDASNNKDTYTLEAGPSQSSGIFA
jgi:hypothetical protein